MQARLTAEAGADGGEVVAYVQSVAVALSSQPLGHLLPKSIRLCILRLHILISLKHARSFQE